jgi:hypothetical protein
MPGSTLTSNRDLVAVGADGKLDLAASEAALESLVAELEREPGRAVVFDLRKARCDFSLSEVYGLVDFLAKQGTRKALYRRIAVLIALPAHQPKASFFSLCAENRGLEAKSFTSVEDVTAWLGSDVSGLLGPNP